MGAGLEVGLSPGLGVAVAGVLDGTVGEPPMSLHPVVAMGRWLNAAARIVPAEPPGRAVTAGGLAWAAGLVGTVAAAVAWQRVSRRLPGPPAVRAVADGVGLWPLFAGRLLLSEVRAVEQALRDADPAEPVAGRDALARIVSRDVSQLNAPGVRAAALESLAENLSDSVVAPLLAHAVGGLPAAAAYRYVNTADASWGYRNDRWEYAGKIAARADDVANLAPSRLTAALLLVGAPPAAWRRLAAEARRTPSPNAGWPMAALALRLGVRLDKHGSYTLNASGRSPGPADTTRALRLARRVVVATATGSALLTGTREWVSARRRARADRPPPSATVPAPGRPVGSPS